MSCTYFIDSGSLRKLHPPSSSILKPQYTEIGFQNKSQITEDHTKFSKLQGTSSNSISDEKDVANIIVFVPLMQHNHETMTIGSVTVTADKQFFHILFLSRE